MNKYIDAEKLKAEIEKRLKNNYINGAGIKYKGPKFYKARGKESAYDALLSIIDSLQQEQSEVELEKEIERIVENEERFMKFQVKEQLIKYVARHFYELGLNARKEE